MFYIRPPPRGFVCRETGIFLYVGSTINGAQRPWNHIKGTTKSNSVIGTFCKHIAEIGPAGSSLNVDVYTMLLPAPPAGGDEWSDILLAIEQYYILAARPVFNVRLISGGGGGNSS